MDVYEIESDNVTIDDKLQQLLELPDKIHDVYFYVSCKLLDKDGKMAEVYKPENPTKESVKDAKKLFKPERSIGKVFQLMSTYKAGAKAIFRKLRILGIKTTFQEVEDNRSTYWGPDLFGAVLDFEDDLLTEVEQRDGWMMNGLGRPFAIIDNKKKDVVNTFCQSTGHDCLDIFVTKLGQLIKDNGLEATPVIEDYHDETIWMCPTEQAEKLAQLMTEAVALTNEAVNFSIKLKGEPEITDTFTEFKGPDMLEWYTKEIADDRLDPVLSGDTPATSRKTSI